MFENVCTNKGTNMTRPENVLHHTGRGYGRLGVPRRRSISGKGGRCPWTWDVASTNRPLCAEMRHARPDTAPLLRETRNETTMSTANTSAVATPTCKVCHEPVNPDDADVVALYWWDDVLPVAVHNEASGYVHDACWQTWLGVKP